MRQLWRYKPEAFSHVHINLLSNLATAHRAELSVMYTSFPLAVYLHTLVYIVSVSGVVRLTRERTCVSLQGTHSVAWQKLTQHCKAIILQSKLNFWIKGTKK